MNYFFDMDGTLCNWRSEISDKSELFKKGYFLSLTPNLNLIKLLKDIIRDKTNEVFILSHYLSDSDYALEEKKQWLLSNVPEINSRNFIFVPCGESKSNYAVKMLRRDLTSFDILIDDYNKNLTEWSNCGGYAIKFLNKINSNNSWKGMSLKL